MRTFSRIARPLRQPRAAAVLVPRRSLATFPTSASRFLDVHPEVQSALAEGRPVVALESTLITHGLPPPHSYDLPVACEDILRAQGVTPATIALIDGKIKVGLTTDELAMLSDKGFAARSDGGKNLWKVGRRELGAALVNKVVGGTTVSGTMAVANMVGIKIFSTGGIGGVHRGAETSFDISSDLIALSDTPVTVVCAGSKSILDIGLTLEYLEAHAVPVAGYGTNDWPAFYTPASGFKAPMRLNGARSVAETIRTTDLLGLKSSLLLGVPIPEEYHAAGDALQQAVEQAVAESVENGVSKTGKAVTPWLLERVGQLTKGNAIVSNMALIKNNVKVGGEVALEYAKLLKEEKKTATCGILLDPKGELVGGVADMDITSNMTGGQVIEKIQQHQPAVVAFDGNLSSDAMGQILAHCETQNIKTFFEPTSNAKALSLLKGIEKHLPTPSPDPLVTFSTPNIHELSTFYSHTSSSETPLYEHGFWFDSINISGDLLASRLPPWVTAEGVAQMAANLLPVIRTIFVKSGSRGVLVVQRVSGEEQVAAWNTPAVRGKKGTVVAASTHLKDEAVVLRYYPALKLEESEVGSVTGAGDNLAGAILAALVRGVDPAFPEGLDIIVDLAQRAAVATLKSTEAVGDHAELRPLLPASKN
ncbi:indigoidine synthase A family protein [Pseudohyphozyma bogoriensis]|nr:indigoidine synthase A family protein [Pseudohyphozyma bogoriensis]